MLTLVLLGQMKMVTKKGMFAGFIDCRKAYIQQSGPRGIMGLFGENIEIGGLAASFLKAVYVYGGEW